MPPSASAWEDMISEADIIQQMNDDNVGSWAGGTVYIDCIVFSDDNKSYAYARYDGTGSVVEHLVLYTNDGWTTLTRAIIILQEAGAGGTRTDLLGRVSIKPDDESTVICAFSRNRSPETDRADLYRSTDFAANWSSIDSVEDAGGEKGGLCCYHTADTGYIYWLARDSGTLRVSVDGGASFATETADGDNMIEMFPRPGDKDILDCSFQLGLYRWDRGGGSFTQLVMTTTLNPVAKWSAIYERDGSNHYQAMTIIHLLLEGTLRSGR
jgi:hypothetical protein